MTEMADTVQVPQALNPAVGFSQYDLRPFYPYQSIPAVTIGLIYLIILSFFSFAFYLPIWIRVRSVWCPFGVIAAADLMYSS